MTYTGPERRKKQTYPHPGRRREDRWPVIGQWLTYKRRGAWITAQIAGQTEAGDWIVQMPGDHVKATVPLVGANAVIRPTQAEAEELRRQAVEAGA